MFPQAWKKKTETLLRFTSLQTLVHGVMALSGFLIVRTLDKSEYAAYTIAISVQTMLTVLTDLGLSTGLAALGGRIWQDPVALGRLVTTTLSLRWRLAYIAVPVAGGLAFFLFRENGVPVTKAIALTICVIGAIGGLFLTNVYSASLRLRSMYTTVQKVELIAAVVRFVALWALALLVLNALTAVLVTGFALTLQGLMLRKKAWGVVTRGQGVDKTQRRILLGLIRKQFFSAVFFAFQGQITIWIISIFGSVEKVADVGALNRLAIIFALVSSVLNGIVGPTFARCETIQRLLRLFSVALLTYAGFATVLLICSFWFPDQLLWVLGSKYSGLTQELPWLITNSIVGGAVAIVYTLIAARGWVWQVWTAPVLTIVSLLVLAKLLDLGTVKGVLILGLGTLVPALIVNTYMALRGFWSSWKMGSLAPVAT